MSSMPTQRTALTPNSECAVCSYEYSWLPWGRRGQNADLQWRVTHLQARPRTSPRTHRSMKDMSGAVCSDNEAKLFVVLPGIGVGRYRGEAMRCCRRVGVRGRSGDAWEAPIAAPPSTAARVRANADVEGCRDWLGRGFWTDDEAAQRAPVDQLCFRPAHPTQCAAGASLTSCHGPPERHVHSDGPPQEDAQSGTWSGSFVISDH